MNMGPYISDAFLNKYPDTLTLPDNDGYMPFHRATAFFNPALMDLILKKGFDVNTPTCTDLKETSLHLAARSGNLMTMKKILDSGGDKMLLDSEGSDVMHHSVSDTSGKCMHYLATVQGMSYKSRDYNKRTILMKSAANGYNDLTKYLLRNERSDILAQDVDGNCVLHLMVTKPENSYITWMLVQADPRLLNIRNCEDKTALDYLTKENKWKSMRNAMERNNTNPDIDWYRKAAIPPVSYVALTTLNTTVITNPFAMAILLAVCFAVAVMQQHRIFNHRRLKNPIFYFIFLTGLIGSAIQTWIKFLPFYILHEVYWVLYVIACTQIYGFYMLYKFTKAVPKAITSSAVDRMTNKKFTMEDISTGLLPPNNFCLNCEIVHSEDVQHCRMCEKCIRGVDHHCLFLYGCVASNNYMLFAATLFSTLVNGVLVVALYAGAMFLDEVNSANWSTIFMYFFDKLDVYMMSMVLGTGQVALMCIGIIFDMSTNHGKVFRPSCATGLKNIRNIYLRRSENTAEDFIDLRESKDEA